LLPLRLKGLAVGNYAVAPLARVAALSLFFFRAGNFLCAKKQRRLPLLLLASPLDDRVIAFGDRLRCAALSLFFFRAGNFLCAKK
jgi:hypothetical protein